MLLKRFQLASSVIAAACLLFGRFSNAATELSGQRFSFHDQIIAPFGDEKTTMFTLYQWCDSAEQSDCVGLFRGRSYLKVAKSFDGGLTWSTGTMVESGQFQSLDVKLDCESMTDCTGIFLETTRGFLVHKMSSSTKQHDFQVTDNDPLMPGGKQVTGWLDYADMTMELPNIFMLHYDWQDEAYLISSTDGGLSFSEIQVHDSATGSQWSSIHLFGKSIVRTYKEAGPYTNGYSPLIDFQVSLLPDVSVLGGGPGTGQSTGGGPQFSAKTSIDLSFLSKRPGPPCNLREWTWLVAGHCWSASECLLIIEADCATTDPNLSTDPVVAARTSDGGASWSVAEVSPTDKTNVEWIDCELSCDPNGSMCMLACGGETKRGNDVAEATIPFVAFTEDRGATWGYSYMMGFPQKYDDQEFEPVGLNVDWSISNPRATVIFESEDWLTGDDDVITVAHLEPLKTVQLSSGAVSQCTAKVALAMDNPSSVAQLATATALFDMLDFGYGPNQVQVAVFSTEEMQGAPSSIAAANERWNADAHRAKEIATFNSDDTKNIPGFKHKVSKTVIDSLHAAAERLVADPNHINPVLLFLSTDSPSLQKYYKKPMKKKIKRLKQFLKSNNIKLVCAVDQVSHSRVHADMCDQFVVQPFGSTSATDFAEQIMPSLCPENAPHPPKRATVLTCSEFNKVNGIRKRKKKCKRAPECMFNSVNRQCELDPQQQGSLSSQCTDFWCLK